MSMYLVGFLVILSSVFGNIHVHDQFLYHEIVPDVLSSPPEDVLDVIFPNGVEAQLGNELTSQQVSGVPELKWNFNPNRYYTLVFCDPDAPSRANPAERSFLHWLVVNIPGNDVSSGKTLTNLKNSNPPPNTGLHRYVFLVFEQPSLVEFEEQPDDSFERRVDFSAEAFAAKYNLGAAVAGNFYQTQNDENQVYYA